MYVLLINTKQFGMCVNSTCIVPTHSRPVYADVGVQVIDNHDGVELNQWINGQTTPSEGMRVFSDLKKKKTI